MSDLHPVECIVHKITRDSMALDDCVKRVLHRLAEITQAMLLLKEFDDDLHADFAPGAIVGNTVSRRVVDAARPIIAKVRYIPACESWQFSIHDRAIYDLYEIERPRRHISSR